MACIRQLEYFERIECVDSRLYLHCNQVLAFPNARNVAVVIIPSSLFAGHTYHTILHHDYLNAPGALGI
jgi:hypothetical protein